MHLVGFYDKNKLILLEKFTIFVEEIATFIFGQKTKAARSCKSLNISTKLHGVSSQSSLSELEIVQMLRQNRLSVASVYVFTSNS